MLREKSQNLRSEVHVIRNESFLARSESENLRSEAKAIRIRSEVLRLESQALRITLFNSDEETYMSLIERNVTYNDIVRDLYDDDDNDDDDELKGLTEHDHDTDTEEEVNMSMTDMNTEDNERTTHLDQINLIVKTRNDFSKNVSEICGLINEL